MDVVQQEDAVAEAGEQLIHATAIELFAAGGAFESLQNARLVALGLQATNKPRAGVVQPLVVEVDRILRRQNDAEPESPRLLQESEQWLLRRRIGDRREVAEDLIHIKDGAQAGRTRLRSHPTDGLVQQQGDEEHALAVAEM